MEYIIDGLRMTSIRKTHRYLKRALHLPRYYGKNLDALNDCLGDFGSDTWIILINGDAMDAALGDYAERLRTVFLHASSGPHSYKFIECRSK